MQQQLSMADAEQLARAGAEALRAGNAAAARQSFERLAASGRANAQIWLLLAHSCATLGDHGAAERAADEVLRRDNRNLRALIMKGDARGAGGDEAAAASFYNNVLRLAAQLGELPADLKAELARVEQAARAFSGRSRARLEAYLAEAGLGPEAQSARFRESIAILLEEKQVYFQQPSAYYFPGLPQRQYYEREEFDWVPAVEAAAGDMLEELNAALAADVPFRPYLQAREDRPTYDFHGLLDNPDWSTLYLWENGGPVEQNVARFPKSFAAMQRLPLPHITTRAPSILFSLLKPGARIEAHNGMINTRLICHLPLIVPPGCGFRVGNEVREWEVGKLLIFDDTIEHEAWNDSKEDRVVLIFDIWRPELSGDERRAVTAIFEAIDAQNPGQAAG
ncbi:MAG TPA: aspartyl/asparaginyl beta-hydroxylase domain-containing protein [Allosphingosinicella sp.]|nr:aspartyl/asparaginyl beta-hydroxylase domain-containing protein [Allosphingosinicella sp.]